MKYQKIVSGIALATSCVVMAGCAVNPVTGKKQVAFMSEAQEKQMGAESDPGVVAEFGLYADSAVQQYIRNRGNEMAKISHRPNLNWTFRVLDSDVVNAFAVPGGYVYFTRGILTHMNNEAQFAGVLGHEIGHVTARHSVSQQSKGLLTQLGVFAAILANKNVAQFAEQLTQGAQLLMLKYSRDHETESDGLGVDYSSKVGYDAKEMAKFFLTLQRLQNQSSHSTLPEFQSTHPDPGNRYEEVTKDAIAYQQATPGTSFKINKKEFYKIIENMVYGEDPRQGFLKDNVFYHPELKFQFSTPTGWQYQNSPSRVQFESKEGDAALIMTLAKGANAQEAANNFVQQNQITALESRATTVNGLPAFVLVGQQAQANQQTGQQEVAIKILATFIQYNNLVYELVGVSAPQSFNNYAGMFQSIGNSFNRVTNPDIINIKPERISLVTVAKPTTLQQLLTAQGIPNTRHAEFALVNGMELTASLQTGDIIKLVKRK